MNAFIINTLLRIAGVLLIVPAMLLSLFVRTPKTEKPWVCGLFKNIWHAYGKYDSASWLRRLISVIKKPIIVKQYWHILRNKQDVVFVGKVIVNISDLTMMHDVQTDHKHHVARVNDCINGNTPVSKYGNIIVVDNYIHDGHHRIAALKEAGAKTALVNYFTTKTATKAVKL